MESHIVNWANQSGWTVGIGQKTPWIESRELHPMRWTNQSAIRTTDETMAVAQAQ